MKTYEKLYLEIGYTFHNPALLKEALTHSSYSNEHGLDYDNQRMEFLGDAVVQLGVSELLYERHLAIDEGKLSQMRSALVNKNMLAKKAREMGLSAFIYLGAGEEQTGGKDKKSNLADCFEAVLGAVYMDGGYDIVRKLVRELFEKELQNISEEEVFINYKSILQEHLQKQRQSVPKYRVKETIGAFHEQTFVVELYINGILAATAQASSKKEAEKAAAKSALEAMKIL